MPPQTQQQSQSQPFAVVAFLSLAIVYSFITVVTYRHVIASDTTTATMTTAVVVPQPASTSLSSTTLSPYEHYRYQSFPLHVHDDTRETIVHPAAAYMTTSMPETLRQSPQLYVPQFFDTAYAHLFGNTTTATSTTTTTATTHRHHHIREYLGNFGQTLVTPEQAAMVGSYTRSNPDFHNSPQDNANNNNNNNDEWLETIYASVASYRDLECAGTVTDLYERAAYPERIRVAIVEQRLDAGEDTKCTTPPVPCTVNATQALCRYRHLMDYFEMDARWGVGPVFARHLAHRHYRGEYYAMQIDSHVRFVQHWDTDIIQQWKSARNEST